MTQDEFIYVSREEIGSSSVEIFEYPVGSSKIPRTRDFFLPKFHFILPNFYFGPPWGISIWSVKFPNFLWRDWEQRRCRSRYGARLNPYIPW